MRWRVDLLFGALRRAKEEARRVLAAVDHLVATLGADAHLVPRLNRAAAQHLARDATHVPHRLHQPGTAVLALIVHARHARTVGEDADLRSEGGAVCMFRCGRCGVHVCGVEEGGEK
jgi:hypothetical protein